MEHSSKAASLGYFQIFIGNQTTFLWSTAVTRLARLLSDFHREPDDVSEGALTAGAAHRAAGGGESAGGAGVPGAAASPGEGGGTGPDHQTQPGPRHEVHHAELQEGSLRPRPAQKSQVGGRE